MGDECTVFFFLQKYEEVIEVCVLGTYGPASCGYKIVILAILSRAKSLQGHPSEECPQPANDPSTLSARTSTRSVR